jgi:hypothetical protein
MNFLPMYLIGAILIGYVLIQSFVFYNKAYKRGLEMGMTKHQLNETTRSSAIFSIVPSIPILIGLVAMVPLFGDAAIPWIRLSVLGSVSYETYAALAVKNAAGVVTLLENMSVYSAAVWTMTISIMSGLIVLIFFYQGYTKKLAEIRKKDSRWATILIAALFMGLVGTIGAQQIVLGGYNLIALLISMAIMAILGGLSFKFKWLEEFALPVSILGTLTALYLIINVFGSKV